MYSHKQAPIMGHFVEISFIINQIVFQKLILKYVLCIFSQYAFCRYDTLWNPWLYYEILKFTTNSISNRIHLTILSKSPDVVWFVLLPYEKYTIGFEIWLEN